MGWFGNGHGKRIADLEAQVGALMKRCAAAEATATECAERAYRFMKKAEARQRRELDEPNQEQAGRANVRGPGATATPVPSGSRRLWGARARRAARILGDPLNEISTDDEGATNGVHS